MVFKVQYLDNSMDKDNANNIIKFLICKKIAIGFDFCKKFAKVLSNTIPSIPTNHQRTHLREHLLKLYFGGDKNDFLSYLFN